MLRCTNVKKLEMRKEDEWKKASFKNISIEITGAIASIFWTCSKIFTSSELIYKWPSWWLKNRRCYYKASGVNHLITLCRYPWLAVWCWIFSGIVHRWWCGRMTMDQRHEGPIKINYTLLYVVISLPTLHGGELRSVPFYVRNRSVFS